jgi:hypothetical protein
MIEDALIDPRLAFLARAHARFILVESGAMDLEEAVDGLIEQFDEIVGPRACVWETIERWERTHPPVRRGQR